MSPIWSYQNPVRVHFGSGTRELLLTEMEGKIVLVVATRAGRNRLANDRVLSQLFGAGDIHWEVEVSPNPDLQQVQSQIDRWKSAGIETVVAIGGGSVIDTAKALAVGLAASDVELATLIRDKAMVTQVSALPLLAVPTTSGTGSEVTPFATIWDHANKQKLSLAGGNTYPAAAYVDPELTLGLPELHSVSTGLDALNQAFESVWNRNATPITLSLAQRAIALGLEALPALARGALDDIEVRSAMAECSLLAGLCISQTRTAICHSISYPLTSHFGVPHGLACAFSMEAVIEMAVEGDDGRLEDLAVVSGLGKTNDLLVRLHEVLELCGVRKACLEAIGSIDALLELRGAMFTPGRADNFFLPMTHDSLTTILLKSWKS